MTKRHSFGGHALDRHLIDYEPDDGLAAADVGGAADPSPDSGTGEPEPSAGATTTPQPPATTDLGEDGLPAAAAADTAAQPDWHNNPDFQQAVEQHAQQVLEQWVAQAQQQPDPEPDQVELDPFADDYPQQLQQLIANTVQGLLGQQLAPLAPLVQQQQEQEAEQWMNGVLDRVGVADDGTLDSDDGLDTRGAVLRASAGFMAYGPDGAPLTRPDQAIQQAADYLKRRDERIAARAVAQYKESLRGGDHGGGFTPYEPSGGFSATEAADLPSSYDDVVSSVLSRTAA